MENYTLYFDGSCGPTNPGGTAAYGYALYQHGEILGSGTGIIGCGSGMSNNLAEFMAVAHGLDEFNSYKYARFNIGRSIRDAIINVRGDSRLVINVMSKKWRARSDKLYYPGFEAADERVRRLRRNGISISFDWIPRELNQECDRLSKAR